MNGADLQTLSVGDLARGVAEAASSGGRMQMVYAWRPPDGEIELRYVRSRAPSESFQVWAVRPEAGGVPSMANLSPLLGWYEREISDLFGLHFIDHPDPSRLVLHQGVQLQWPPFDPKAPADQPLSLRGDIGGMPEVESEDVQRLPWGPVRADVVESAEFVFFYIGEHILHLHPQLFFKHRGMEKRFEGLTTAAGAVLAERVSGVGSFCHALAFCQAVEAAAGCEAPPRARLLRTVLAELERLYNHLHYLGYLADTTTLKVGAAEGKLLEERVKQLNARLTGSRFLRSLLAPGGLRQDLEPGEWLSSELHRLEPEITTYMALLEDTGTHLDRLITTGLLSRQTAFEQGATGPVSRASGIDRDLRRDHPYAAYGEYPVAVAVRTDGDAHAREQVRMAEIVDSLALIHKCLAKLETGPVRSPCDPPPHSEGLGWAESPRGTLLYAVHLDDQGRLGRVKIKSPSFSNWRVFPHTVHDTNMMDYAINEASFGLTIAGCDR